MAKRKSRRSLYKKIDKSRAEGYEYHLPVLLEKSVDYLITDPKGIYIDGTLGGGGHTSLILSRLVSGGKILAFDKDAIAISHCSSIFEDELAKGIGSRLTLYNQSFESACGMEEIRGKISGLLLDLGVSSRQLDDGSRGFTYRVNASLDMRFASHGRSAEALLAAATEEELEEILRLYGEEPHFKAIARRICEMRRAVPLKSTFQLRDLVEKSVPSGQLFKSLSRTFQAIRIAVNDELKTLQNTLTQIIPMLDHGARIVVISYHSLEDRIVKSTFKENSSRFLKERNKYKPELAISMPKLKILTPKPIIPGEEELLRNPRARSAKLRVAERV